jgi:hypothetical protein
VSAGTASRPGRGGVRGRLRRRFGIWPLLEARNRIVLGPRSLAVSAFELREVARLRAGAPAAPRRTVATVIPTYRRPDLLRQAVRSALAQTVEDQTVVVVDDGGGLPELPADRRLMAVSLSRNCGIAGVVRNVGIALTDSEFVAFLDDDNEWRPDHLERALEGLRSGAALVYTAVERHRPDGSLVDVLSVPFDRRVLADAPGFVDMNAVVVRRGPGVRFSRLPRVRTTVPREDWEFVHRLSRTGAVRHLPTPTVRYLLNDASYFSAWGTPA